MDENNIEEHNYKPEGASEPVETGEELEASEPEIKMSEIPEEPEKKRMGVLAGFIVLIVIVIVIAMVFAIMVQQGSSDDSGDKDVTVDVSSDEITCLPTYSLGVVCDGDNDNAVSIKSLSGGEVKTTIGNKEVTYKAKYIVDGVVAVVDSGTYESTNDDEVVFLVINGGTLQLDRGVIINKTGSEDFDGRGDTYSFYGTNSAVVVVGEKSQVAITGTTINTSVDGANAVVATNGGSVIFSDITINTTKDASRGLHATYGGKIVGNAGTVLTQGKSCAALATDRGEGSVKVSQMKLNTAGAGSPLIYSTGEIEVSSSTGTATGAQIAVVEGKNSIVLKDCDFSANGVGNRKYVDNAAVMIYQSMSGDASVGAGSFTANDSKLTVLSDSEVYETTPLFFVTNTTAEIALDGVEASFYEDGYFILAAGTNEWGKSGSNGGVVTIDAVNLTVTNTNVGVDEISSVNGL